VTFTWTGDGQVTETNGAADLDATTCTTTGGACQVTVESPTPGTGTIEITAVTADFGSGPITGETTTTPPTLSPEQGEALTADKTWVVVDVDITPLQAVNPIGAQHTFTISVLVDDGSGLVPLSVPPNSGTVDWSWDAPDGTTAAGTCTLGAGGTCDVTRNSDVGGVGTLTATALDVVYGGATLPTVDLTAPGPGQAPELSVPVQAVKDWVGYVLTLDPPNAVNVWPADPDHVVTLSLEVFPPELVNIAPIAGQAIDVTLASSVATITDVSDGTFTPTTARCITDGSGQCQVTITSNGPGAATLSAIYDHDFQGQETPIAGNDADKTWRTYRVDVTPPNATNLLGEPHVFSVLVERSDNGTTWTPAVGVTPNLNVTSPGSITAQTCAGGTNRAGRCTATVASPRTGAVTMTARYTAQGATANASFTDTADKRWIDYRVTLTPERAVNTVSDPHVFTALLEVDRGSGFVPAGGRVLRLGTSGTGVIVNATPEGPSGMTCRTGTSGRCSITVNSDRPGSLTLTARFGASVGGTTRNYTASAMKSWTPPPTTDGGLFSPFPLPRTGSPTRDLVLIAGILLAIGLAALGLTRRRT